MAPFGGRQPPSPHKQACPQAAPNQGLAALEPCPNLKPCLCTPPGLRTDDCCGQVGGGLRHAGLPLEHRRVVGGGAGAQQVFLVGRRRLPRLLLLLPAAAAEAVAAAVAGVAE